LWSKFSGGGLPSIGHSFELYFLALSVYCKIPVFPVSPFNKVRRLTLLDIFTRAMARQVPRVRLVGEGTNEIVPTEFALRQADDMGLDLVIVSDKSDPPVVRIQDFKKLEYERKKAKQGKTRTSELKEIQLKVNISDHDLQTKIGAVKRFLERGDKVKLMVRLKGRERETPERAQALINRVAEAVQCKVSRLPGPMTIAILEAGK
jgi:translation initiation factor IF-3